VVPPLEGLWWSEDPSVFVQGDREDWQWTMMIMVPDWVDDALVSAAIGKAQTEAAVRLETLEEGASLQILHIGSYADEAPTLHRLHHEYMPENGWTFNGHHHEIYTGDPRKSAPEKLKTVLRQPVRRDRG
jgi:hypothetical protein